MFKGTEIKLRTKDQRRDIHLVIHSHYVYFKNILIKI